MFAIIGDNGKSNRLIGIAGAIGKSGANGGLSGRGNGLHDLVLLGGRPGAGYGPATGSLIITPDGRTRKRWAGPDPQDFAWPGIQGISDQQTLGVTLLLRSQSAIGSQDYR